MSCKDGKWNVDEEERENCRPDGDTVDEFLIDIFEHCREVDSVDWRDEACSEAGHQVATEPRSLRCRDFRLISFIQSFIHKHNTQNSKLILCRPITKRRPTYYSLLPENLN